MLKIYSRLAAVTLAAFALSAGTAYAQQAYAIANDGSTLITFNLANPAAATAVGNFSGFPGNLGRLSAIDFRPATGVLYGYSDDTGTLYTVDLGYRGTQHRRHRRGHELLFNGLDFNPDIDRVRVVNDAQENRVFNPGGGPVTWRRT
jgi:WD40 repeat protein